MTMGIVDKIINLNEANGYISDVVVGKLGIGKSSYCLRAAFQYYKMHLGFEDEEAWKSALNCVLFDINDIIDHFKTHSYHNRADITIVDDASVYLGSSRWFTDQQSIMELEILLTTSRTSTKCLLFNAPNVMSLMRYLRYSEGFRTKVTTAPGNPTTRHADVYGSYIKTTQTGMSLCWRYQWTDQFEVMLPDWVFKHYMSKRIRYKDAFVKSLEARQGSKTDDT